MIEMKLLEIRDHGTFVPALAIRVEHEKGGLLGTRFPGQREG